MTTGDSRHPLNIKNPLCRYAVLRPSSDGRFVYGERCSDSAQGSAMLSEKDFQIVPHSGYSCAKPNSQSRPELRFAATTAPIAMRYKLQMAQVTRIHHDKTPRRIHYIVEWMERRQRIAADLVRATGADKGTVSRWINDGVIPSERYRVPLAEYLQLEEPALLFRHPDDDWLSRLFRDRTAEDLQRMIQTIEVAFPRKAS